MSVSKKTSRQSVKKSSLSSKSKKQVSKKTVSGIPNAQKKATKVVEVIKGITEVFKDVEVTVDERKKYTDDHKMIVMTLYAQGKSYREIMEITKVASKSTIHNWIHELADYETRFQEMGHKELIERAKEQLSGKQYLLANRIIASVTDEDLTKASLLQKTTAHCQLVDKARLMENKSTSNIAFLYQKKGQADTDISDTDKAIQALEAEIEEIED